MKSSIVIIFLILATINLINCQYPVPIPKGGRNAVHGWLILPLDQEYPTDPSTPVSAYFSHHTPEFPSNSPHNFQIILLATLTPITSGDNITYPLDLPYPPSDELVVDEFTFTPPPPFSLNDLLSGQITQLLGVVFNGSFDTPYERIAMSIATLDILELTTAVWLNSSSEIESYPSQRYLSYPRAALNSQPMMTGVHNFYLAHEIHAVPDFDQVVHVTIDLDSCTCDSSSNSNCKDNPSSFLETVYKPSAEWEFSDIPNDVSNRLQPSTTPSLSGSLVSTGLSCKFEVLEQIHCVLGPDFYQIC